MRPARRAELPTPVLVRALGRLDQFRPVRRGPRAVRPVRALVALLPLLVTAAVVIINVAVGPDFVFLAPLAVGPALAAVSMSPGGTGLVGCLSLALCMPIAQYDGLLHTERTAGALLTISGVTAAGMVASHGRQRRERELANVRAVAEAAQRVLLRPVPPRIGHVSVAARYISANVAAHIGGDLYEVIQVGDTVRLIIGDVQGHGLAAVQTAAVILGAFRERAHDAPGLAEIAASIEISLRRQASGDDFATAVLAQLPAAGPMEILNCGHPPPLVLSGGKARFIEPPETELPLGLSQLAASPRQSALVPLGPGDRVLFYTDGISEARGRSGEFFPVERSLAALAGREFGAIPDELSAGVARHVGRQLRDDAALLLVSRDH
jgi:serine phosphatase RsbU (regulator of sigma subunit)